MGAEGGFAPYPRTSTGLKEMDSHQSTFLEHTCLLDIQSRSQPSIKGTEIMSKKWFSENHAKSNRLDRGLKLPAARAALALPTGRTCGDCGSSLPGNALAFAVQRDRRRSL
jgi:hypothetical protein